MFCRVDITFYAVERSSDRHNSPHGCVVLFVFMFRCNPFLLLPDQPSTDDDDGYVCHDVGPLQLLLAILVSVKSRIEG